jgi:hypothetical protein
MTVNDLYGTQVYGPADLADILAEHRGLTFAEHESYYRGVYYLADASPYRVEVQPNAIPGDDGQGDLYDPDHPQTRTLVLVTGPHREPAVDVGLATINALELLQPKELNTG